LDNVDESKKSFLRENSSVCWQADHRRQLSRQLYSRWDQLGSDLASAKPAGDGLTHRTNDGNDALRNLVYFDYLREPAEAENEHLHG
jgi:hypothetical protein